MENATINSHFANDRSASEKKERKEGPDEDHDGGISERRISDKILFNFG
jgi:hypothetical protein